MVYEEIFSDQKLIAEIKKYARIKNLKKGDVLMSPGDAVVFMPIVEKGNLRIVRQNDDGKEMFLYHLYPGQTCALSINCCQSNKKSQVKAIAEADTELVLVPVQMIEQWLQYNDWKNYINNTYGYRFSELLHVIDLIAFSNMDKQILYYLKEKSKALQSKNIKITHQQIADELHTQREAVSRLLRAMENKKLVKLNRNSIELLA